MRQLILIAALGATLVLTTAATAAPNPSRYAERLAQNARTADTWQNCLVLRTVDLCGWRLRYIRESTAITAEAGGCRNRGCWYQWDGQTAATRFFCRGYMAWYPRARRWVADQSVNCYADDDPSWYFTDDGVL